MKTLITNFAYGTGPFLRTTELYVATMAALARRGKEPLPVVIPWVYGDKQARIMNEESFIRVFEAEHPEHLLLDHEYGELLAKLFYIGEKSYAQSLAGWVAEHDAVAAAIREHFSRPVVLTTLAGKQLEPVRLEIVAELNRSPRVLLDLAPAFSTNFGHTSEILRHSLERPASEIALDQGVARRGIALAERIEAAQKSMAMAYPGTFSGDPEYRPRYPQEVLTPPITNPAGAWEEPIDEGIFVTITGIPGLERLYQEARDLGIKLYCNDPKSVPGSERQLPHVIPSRNILFQFARSGWGSVWLSMQCGTPIVVPDFDPTDDPEIYWNNQMVERLGIGMVYRGQPLAEILSRRDEIRANCARVCAEIRARWGTLDGNAVAAREIAGRLAPLF